MLIDSYFSALTTFTVRQRRKSRGEEDEDDEDEKPKEDPRIKRELEEISKIKDESGIGSVSRQPLKECLVIFTQGDYSYNSDNHLLMIDSIKNSTPRFQMCIILIEKENSYMRCIKADLPLIPI